MSHADPWLPPRSGGTIPVKFALSAFPVCKWLRALYKTAAPSLFTIAASKGQSNISSVLHPDHRSNTLLASLPFNISAVEQELLTDMARR
jgi:hypothetical protein